MAESVNKAEADRPAVRQTSASPKRPPANIEAIVENEITKSVAKGDKVAISGFGVFRRPTIAARVGRNPQTGATVKIKATSVPKFRAGAGSPNAVAGKPPREEGRPGQRRLRRRRPLPRPTRPRRPAKAPARRRRPQALVAQTVSTSEPAVDPLLRAGSLRGSASQHDLQHGGGGRPDAEAQGVPRSTSVSTRRAAARPASTQAKPHGADAVGGARALAEARGRLRAGGGGQHRGARAGGVGTSHRHAGARRRPGTSARPRVDVGAPPGSAARVAGEATRAPAPSTPRQRRLRHAPPSVVEPSAEGVGTAPGADELVTASPAPGASLTTTTAATPGAAQAAATVSAGEGQERSRRTPAVRSTAATSRRRGASRERRRSRCGRGASGEPGTWTILTHGRCRAGPAAGGDDGSGGRRRRWRVVAVRSGKNGSVAGTTLAVVCCAPG